MARFAIKQRVTHPEELQAFTGAALSGRLAMPQSPACPSLRHLLAHDAGGKGAWTYCEEDSTETTFVFHRISKDKSSKTTAKPSAKRKDASTGVNKQHKGAGTAVVSPKSDRKRKGAKK